MARYIQNLTIILLSVLRIKAMDQTKLIYESILTGYNPHLRPVISTKITTVQINPVLISLEGVNEPQEYIDLAYWFYMEWQDDRLRWDPVHYKDIDKIAVPSKLLWIPDVMLATVTRLIEIPKAENVFCKVNSTGRTVCQFNQVLTTKCPMNVGMFPFDRQNCTLLYYSWSYGANELQLTTPQRQGNIKYLKNNTEWEFQSYTNEVIMREYTTSNFSEVRYFLVIKRKPMYYIYTLLLPSFLITTLALIGLFSPFSATGEREEKVSMGLTTLLTMAVLLLVISEQMPKTSQGLPMMGIYILFEIMISSTGTVTTVLIMYLQKYVVSGKNLPNWLCFLGSTKNKKKQFSNNNFVYFKRESLAGNQFSADRESTKQEFDAKMTDLDPDVRSQIEECLKDLKFVKSFVEQKQLEEETIRYWTGVCYRFDLFCLFLFNFINFSFSLIWAIVGFSN